MERNSPGLALVDGIDIGEFKARVLTYTVGGTELTNTVSNVYNAELPILFSQDYGLRDISITLVFTPRYAPSNSVFDRLHTLTEQKSRLDAMLYGKAVDIRLPDGYDYRCVLESTDSTIDGIDLEAEYKFKGIRHLPMRKQSGTQVFCTAVSPKTPCRIQMNIKKGWNRGDGFIFGIKNGSAYRTTNIKNLTAGDSVVLDGIESRVLINGESGFDSVFFLEFPYLNRGANEYRIVTTADKSLIEVTTEWFEVVI